MKKEGKKVKTMATAGREGPELANGGGGKARPVPRTELPEVDRIIDGSKFRDFPLLGLAGPTPKVPKVPRIGDGRSKFRKLAAHSKARGNTTTPIDHISKMPDEILEYVISLLTMREAAATSVLSTRWRNLWTASLYCLDFDIPNMIGRRYPDNIFENKDQNYIRRERSNFTKWVNHVIMQFRHASRLDALRVSFVLNDDSASDIDRWIISSVAQGVTEIHLDFHHDDFYGDVHNSSKDYQFPVQQVALTIRYLYLKFCKLHFPPDFTGFTSLVSLSLYAVNIPQSLIENIILPKCPLLEFLSLESCWYPRGTSFSFAGTSLRLKHLHIGSTDGVTIIKVHNINLLSFELGLSTSKLSIQNAPHLTRLLLLLLHPIVISNTPHLDTLFLAQCSEKRCAVPQTYVLNNLKRLVFIAHHCTTNLLGVVRILEACHLLQKLELDMGIMEKSERKYTRPLRTLKKLTALPGFPLNNLKEVEIYGFEDYPEKVELAKYLLNNAVVLEEMKIYTTSKVYHGNGRWEPREATRKLSLEKFCKLFPNVERSSTKVELYSSLPL